MKAWAYVMPVHCLMEMDLSTHLIYVVFHSAALIWIRFHLNSDMLESNEPYLLLGQLYQMIQTSVKVLTKLAWITSSPIARCRKDKKKCVVKKLLNTTEPDHTDFCLCQLLSSTILIKSDSVEVQTSNRNFQQLLSVTK